MRAISAPVDSPARFPGPLKPPPRDHCSGPVLTAWFWRAPVLPQPAAHWSPARRRATVAAPPSRLAGVTAWGLRASSCASTRQTLYVTRVGAGGHGRSALVFSDRLTCSLARPGPTGSPAGPRPRSSSLIAHSLLETRPRRRDHPTVAIIASWPPCLGPTPTSRLGPARAKFATTPCWARPRTGSACRGCASLPGSARRRAGVVQVRQRHLAALMRHILTVSTRPTAAPGSCRCARSRRT